MASASAASGRDDRAAAGRRAAAGDAGSWRFSVDDGRFRCAQRAVAGVCTALKPLRGMLREGGAAGLRPAPATSQGNGRSNSNSDSGLSVGWRGGSGCGRRRKPAPRSGPVAGGWAFGRLRSSASQAKRPHPWGLGRGLLVCAVLRTRQDRGGASCPTRPRYTSAHAADTPATGPTPPSTVFRDLSARGVRSVFRRKTDLTPDRFRYLTDVSTKVDTYQQPPESVEGGALWVGGCEPHGCGDQAPMDGFTASPQTHSAPPSHGMHAIAVALALASAVQGAALPNPLKCLSEPARTARRSAC